MKLAILLAAHGSRRPEANASFTHIQRRVKDIFPQAEVRFAFTSRHVRRRLAEAGESAASVLSALSRLREEGFDHVAVQSLHVIPGVEFLAIERALRDASLPAFPAFKDGDARLAVGGPLLSCPDDAPAVARAALSQIPAERRSGEAVAFMGHGTALPRNALYAALQRELSKLDPDVHVGILENESGPLSLDAVIAGLRERSVRRVWLLPFLTIAGRHALNDLAGEGAASWKSRIEKAGVECLPSVSVAADHPAYVELWLKRLREVVGRLERGETRLGTLHGLGAGPGDPGLMTIKAANVLARAGVVFTAASAGRSIVQSVVAGRIAPGTPVEELIFPMTRDPEALERAWEENGLRALSALRRGLDVAFVALGDPLSWSTFGKLLKTVRELAPEVQVEITPGVTSWQAAAAKAQVPLAEGDEVLLVTADREGLDERLARAENVVLLKAGRDFPALAERLRRLGLADNALLFSNLGLEGETIRRGVSGIEEDQPYLSLLLVKRGG